MERPERKLKGPKEKLDGELPSCREMVLNIINRSVDATLIVDRKGRIRFANPAAANLFCRRTGELLGQDFGFPVVGGERTEIEVVCRGRPSAVVEMRAVETEWEGDKACLATLRDVTERKKLKQELQQALKRSEEARSEIDAILRSVAEGLIVTDRQNRIVLMNHSSELMLGLTCRQVVGLPIDQVFREEPSRSRVLDALTSLSGERFDLELRGQPQEGFRTLQARISVIGDREGKKGGAIITLQDVTRAREIERMKSEFVAIAAHDLRNPLTTIIGYSDAMLTFETLGNDELKKFTNIIREQAYAMSDLIDNFLDISRIESGEGIPLKKTLSNVEELIRQVDPYIRMHSDRFSFRIDLEQKATVLVIDCKRMGQVLLNLLSNAEKYSPGGGLIRIEGRAYERWYRLSVEDQGIGMKPEQVERIFDKFYRADTSPLSPRGVGLGMSIVKNLVEAHEGKIWVESEFGKGTAVRFMLPTREEKKS